MPYPTELSYEICLSRLREQEVGRIAVCTSDGPRIVPVNYSVLDDDTLVFRTTPYGAIGSNAVGNQIALEIDRIDPEHRSGWSVVAAGRGASIDDTQELRRIHAFRDPDPWAAGQRWLYVALRWTELTGRAVGSRGATMAG